MALFMSCLMSIVITIFNVGMISNFLVVWLKAWGFSFVVAYPSVLIVVPIVNKLVNKCVEPYKSET